MNERIYYSVDAIHEAINDNKQITFQYFVWTVDKKMELKHDGAYYHVSPWALCWDDKMTNTDIVNEKRLGKAEFSQIKMTEYTNRLFGMFEGEPETVKLLCENHIANIMFDRFGTDVPVVKVDADHFEINVKVSVSKLFLSWIMALPGVKIIAPDKTVEAMKVEITRLQELYFKNRTEILLRVCFFDR